MQKDREPSPDDAGETDSSADRHDTEGTSSESEEEDVDALLKRPLREELEAALKMFPGKLPPEAAEEYLRKVKGTVEDQLRSVAPLMGMEFVRLSVDAATPEVVKLIPSEIARHLAVFPVRTEGETVVVAVDAASLHLKEALELALGRPVVLALAFNVEIDRMIHRFYPRAHEGEPGERG